MKREEWKQAYGTRAQGNISKAKKKVRWNYDEFIDKANEALRTWRDATYETVKLLYEQKNIMSKQKGQSKDFYARNYVPTWKDYCEYIALPDCFEKLLSDYDSLRKQKERISNAEKAKRKKRGIK